MERLKFRMEGLGYRIEGLKGLIGCVLSLTLLVACSHRAPHPKSDEGILIIPMHAYSPNKTSFSYRYIARIEGPEARDVHIRPNVSKDFIAVKRLRPGHYVLSSIDAIGRRNHKVMALHRYLPTTKTHLEFVIEPGSVTVLKNAFVVKSNVKSRYQLSDDKWYFHSVDDHLNNALRVALDKGGYLPNWKLSSTSSSALTLQ